MTREWEDGIDLAFLPELLRAPAEAAVDYGVNLVGRTSLRDTPRRTGQTAASQTTSRDGTRGRVEFHSRKALALHENTRDRHPRGGRAKFLELALVGSAAAIRKRALAEFRAAIQGGR